MEAFDLHFRKIAEERFKEDFEEYGEENPNEFPDEISGESVAERSGESNLSAIPILSITEKRAALSGLKQMVREHSPFHGVETLPCSLISSGLPKGSLCEIQGQLGTGITDAATLILAEHPTKRCAWIERDFTLFPTGSLQRGIQPGQLLMIQSGREMLWSALETLRSQLFDFLVLTNPGFDDKDLRRLQMMAEKSGTCVLVLNHLAGLRTDSRQDSSAISLTVKIRRLSDSRDLDLCLHDPRFQSETVRRRMAVGI